MFFLLLFNLNGFIIGLILCDSVLKYESFVGCFFIYKAFIMKDDFYTMGGGHFWEDVFFYQKWRIQRNYVTKKCRLLDNWDIRRHEGSFEECRKAFIAYIEAYQLARQKGHMIIMIHSLGQSKNIFKPLWRRALKNGFMAAAVNYPSTQKGLDAHVKQFHFFLDHLEDVDTISFVTYGIGSVILQKLFADKAQWQSRLKLARIVEVAPYTYGSELMEFLGDNKLTGFFVGPMAKDLAPDKVKKLPQISEMPLGIILTNKPWWKKILETITLSLMPKPLPNEVKDLTKAKDVVYIRSHRLNIFNNKEICRATVDFLKKGKF